MPIKYLGIVGKMIAALPTHIRVATNADVNALVLLINGAYRGDSSRKGWTTEADYLGGQRCDSEMLLEDMAQPDSALLIMEQSGQAVGCVYLKYTRDTENCYLGMLTLSPLLQAQGLGSKLLAYAEAFALKTWHATAIEMTVITRRQELIAWYQRRHYQLTAQKKPFPSHDSKFGLPKIENLEFVVMTKFLN